MAFKNMLYPLRGANGQDLVLFQGAFLPDTNTSYPHTVAQIGGGTRFNQYSVSKTGTGTYVVTLNFATNTVAASVWDVWTTFGPLVTGASGVAINPYVTAANNGSGSTPATLTISLIASNATATSSVLPAVEPTNTGGIYVCFLGILKAGAGRV
jgi:hypothetical protein